VNVKRYFGRTNKEAMSKLRAELGYDAVVLRNRAVDGGVEILAMPEAPEAPAPERAGARPAGQPAAAPASRPEADRDDAAAVPEMSTVSFQQYVRERLAQKLARNATLDEVVDTRAPAQPVFDEPAPVHAQPARRVPSPAAPVARVDAPEADEAVPLARPAARRAMAPMAVEPDDDAFAPARPAAARAPAAHEAVAHTPAVDARQQARVLEELRDMRHFIAEQLSSLAFVDGARRSPLQTRLLRQLLGAGFSPALARALVARLPSDYGEAQADQWIRQGLARNLQCGLGNELFEQGGVFALVGPTGVGKTTSAAKIAARFALRHGVQSVGLITVDAYRIGAKDQLRSYGKMLGVPVHVAHDAATLADFLQLFQKKKVVLIDTAGVGQRDERVDELLASLRSIQVRRLVVLNAAAQAETLEDVVRAYRAQTAAGIVVSKVDEAVKLGGVLDCALRHRLQLVGVANGQRVPEDWHAPAPQALVETALAVRPQPVFEFDERELGMMFVAGAGSRSAAARSAHA